MKKNYFLTMLLSLLCFAGYATAQEVTWELVYENSLSATESSGVNITDDPVYTAGDWTVQNACATAEPEFEGLDNNNRYGPFLASPAEGDFFAVKVYVEPGNYKFSFRHKKGSDLMIYTGLVYGKEDPSTGSYDLAKSFGDHCVQKAGADSGDLYESNRAIEITEAGDYYFSYYISYCEGENAKLRIADFKLYKEVEEQPDWGIPTGTTRSGLTNYVTSATTEGATTELAYTNDAHPGSVYTYTGAGMTVEQGQTFKLQVTATEDMKWSHAIVYVDWNLDYDFDDEGEQLFKVGSDVNDNDVIDNLSGIGNVEVKDFTRDITVPADAAVGTTRMRIQYTDAWHIKNVDHPDHTAMDVIDQGGVYDFDVTITAAETVDPEEPEQDWIVIASNTMSSTTPGGWDKTGIVVANWMEDNYSGGVLEGLPYSYSMINPNYGFEVHYKVEVPNDGTYKFSYRSRHNGDITLYLQLEYQKWVKDYNMSMMPDGEVVSDVIGLTGSSELPGTQLESYELELTAGTYYFTIISRDYEGTPNSTRAWVGDFKLYFLNDGSMTTYPVNISCGAGGTLAVSDGVSQIGDGTDVLEGTELTITATPNSGYELESLTVNGDEFTSGDTYTVTGATDIVATFAALPTYAVTWEVTNGSIAVYDTGLKFISNGQRVLGGTQLFIDVTPAANYELESLTLNGEPFDAKMFTVNEDCHFVATMRSLATYTLTYSFEGDAYGSMNVTQSYATDVIPSGSTLSAGTSVMVTVTMTDPTAKGTIDINGVTEEFNYADTDGTYYTHFNMDQDVNVSVVLTGDNGIGSASVNAVYYDSASQTLYVGEQTTLRLYDVTGNIVCDKTVDATCDLSWLADGIYIAVVDGKTVKFRK